MKKNTKKILFGGIALLLLGTGGYLIYKYIRKPKFSAKELEPDKTIVPEVQRDDKFPLKTGSFGLRVRNLQKMLNILAIAKKIQNYDKLDIDGDFGSKTNLALQKVMGISTVSKDKYNAMAKAFNDIKDIVKFQNN